MARVWYYVNEDGEEVGPVKASVIREAVRMRTIRRETLVWRDDLPEWVAAGRIRKLFPNDPTHAYRTPTGR